MTSLVDAPAAGLAAVAATRPAPTAPAAPRNDRRDSERAGCVGDEAERFDMDAHLHRARRPTEAAANQDLVDQHAGQRPLFRVVATIELIIY